MAATIATMIAATVTMTAGAVATIDMTIVKTTETGAFMLSFTIVHFPDAIF